MLHAFVAANQDEIIERCRAKVAGRSGPPPTKAEIDHGVPLFLDQLMTTSRLGLVSSPEISQTALLHGHDLRRQGFTVSQVVHDYGDVCQSIMELATERNATISPGDIHTLNACLDDAIAGAVTEYGAERHRSDLDEESARGTQRALAHELRNLLSTATYALDVLKTGNVGVMGSTGAVLGRSLKGMSALINYSLAEVRVTKDVLSLTPVLVADFINELAESAALEAHAKAIVFTVPPVDKTLTVEADRVVLGASVGNLLQNAFKFTRPGSTVTLRVDASHERVRIEVHDECGGLPDGEHDTLFRPLGQRGADRTGLGLGLAFSRWAVEAHHGQISVRSVPGVGCVFTIDLPRFPPRVPIV